MSVMVPHRTFFISVTLFPPSEHFTIGKSVAAHGVITAPTMPSKSPQTAP
jgi:hypothetical protein